MKVIAVIGCGRISDIAHLPTLSQLENVRIKYACDILIDKAKEKQKKYPKIENVIDDYHIALKDKEVDAVYVLTPNYSHYTITIDALKAGKNVFCEKPITINYELSKKMKDVADKEGKILNIGVCNRYHKSVEMLEELVKNNELGNVYHVYCSFRNFRNIPGLGGPFTTKSISGGGVLIDWGIHFLDLILYVLGGPKIKTVTCNAYSEMAKNMKTYKHFGNMWASDTSNIENGTNDVEDFVSGYIRTEKASISFNGAWAQNICKDEMFIDFLGDKKGARLTYGGKFELYDGDTLEVINPEYDIPNMYLEENKDFIRSIETGKKNKNNIDYILESAKLLDALYKSSKESREIKL
ncbi:MAG: Gfo/Idh/MocA family oxidoreductase [Bacilli bacterium]|nr:Gfo/Idh/MocA family oxidoreductase [Bacilli bacterium]